MEKTMNRRKFLKISGAGVGSLAVSPLLEKAASAKPGRLAEGGKKVIVVGAGLSGLAVAYELNYKGYDVVVLEAQSRPGGRIHTVRAPFSDGLHVEAGGMFVPDHHDFTMKYIRELEVDVQPIYMGSGESVYHVGGKRLIGGIRKVDDWPFELTEQEKQQGVSWRSNQYINKLVKKLGDPRDPEWPGEDIKYFDKYTLAGLLKKHGASPGAIKLLGLGYLDSWGEGIDSFSALAGLRDMRLADNFIGYMIKNGADNLPKAFARKLQKQIHYGAAVTYIEQNSEGVKVVYQQVGVKKTLRADHVVCAIPFSVLKNVDVSPAFSSWKQRAINELPFTSLSRIFLQFKKRFWLDSNLSGFSYTDLPIMWTRNMTGAQPGPRGILEAYITGDHSRKITAMKEPERLSYVLKYLNQIFPGAEDHVEAGYASCWDADPWARGGYSWLKPGQLAGIGRHIATPEGRIHFAGDHTSKWPSWMQGAFESGNRVAREIAQATS